MRLKQMQFPAQNRETQPAPPMKHATEADAVGVTSFIEIDDFAKVDLRVGQVLVCRARTEGRQATAAEDRSRRRTAATGSGRHRSILRT